MIKQIHTAIQINATPEKVWKVLTSFDKYHEWNSFIKTINGTIKEKNKIIVKLQGITFKPIVLTLKENKEFKWQGSLLFKGLFDGTHKFHLTDNRDGTTYFEHSETFSGVLVSLFSKMLENTKLGFETMNKELKYYVENY